MTRRSDLGRWHHGKSNALVCNDEACDFEDGPLSDAVAIKRAREHVAETGHTVEHERTVFRYIRPYRGGSDDA